MESNLINKAFEKFLADKIKKGRYLYRDSNPNPKYSFKIFELVDVDLNDLFTNAELKKGE